LNALPFVIVAAVAWHFGLALYEYRHRPDEDRPSLARLLLLAEMEVLRTLRAELKRRAKRSPEGPWGRKLSRVDDRLKELNEDEKQT
jgi:hypothetical protein